MNNTMPSNNIFEISFSGKDVKPDTVKVSDIADILKAIENMVETKVFRDHPEIDKEQVIVGFINIKSSSLDLQFASQIPEIIMSAFQDIGYAIKTDNYEKIPSSSFEAIDTIITFTRKKQCIAELVTYNGRRNVIATVTPKTVVSRRPLLSGETTIYGEIIRVGGRTPKVMLETIDGQTIYCDAEKTLATRLGEKLYKLVCLSGIAHWDSDTLKIEQLFIKEILPYEYKKLSEAFKELAEVTRTYYSDINDVEKYIESVRGSGVE